MVELAAALNASVGAEVLANQDTSLNLATIDEPLGDREWLLAEIIAAIEADPQRQRDAIGALVNYSDPGCVARATIIINKHINKHINTSNI